MPREPRQYSKTNIYHVMYKGIDNEDIFYNDNDKSLFLKNLIEGKNEFQYKIYAYCLMSNHIHIVLEIKDEVLSNAMKSLSLKYVLYFNKRYSRSGPLFQNRFNSKCVENQKYFLDVCRYIEQNPEKAGICKAEEYKWNSFHEYIGKEKIIDKEKLLKYFNNDVKSYTIFTTKGKSENKEDFIEYELRNKMQDDEVAEFIKKEFKLNNIKEFKNLPREEFEKSIEILKNLQYTRFSQIARVIRMNKYQLKKYWK